MRSWPEGKGPFPTCILVHGGGFTKGDKQSYIKPLFEPLSKAGFTWFTINYRLAPQHRWASVCRGCRNGDPVGEVARRRIPVDGARIRVDRRVRGGHLVCMLARERKDETAARGRGAVYAPHDLELQGPHPQCIRSIDDAARN